MKCTLIRSALAIFFMGSVICYSQTQETLKTHEVQRGESLTSICVKYGVSEQQMKEVNPDLNKYFYVGMRLTIPVVASDSTNPNNNTNTTANIPVQEENTSSGNIDLIQSQQSDNNIIIKNTSTSNPSNTQLPKLCEDYYVQYRKNDGINYYGFSYGSGKSNGGFYGTLGYSFGLGSNDVIKNFYAGTVSLGFGVHKRFIADGFLFQFQAFPYVGYYSDSYTLKYDDSNVSHDKFSYGFTLSPQIGFKMLTTEKNNDLYLTGGYRMCAVEFDFNSGFVKNGEWHIGMTLVVR